MSEPTTEWQELRREIEELFGWEKRGPDSITRAAVLAIVDRLAAATASLDAGIDVERLARAMWATRKRHKDSFATPTAEAVFVAREYERMGS